MKRTLLFVLSICITMQALCSELLPETKKVKVAYEAIVRDGSLPENQLFFLRSFPNTKDTFLRVFIPNEYDQLYAEKEAYMDSFRKFGLMYPDYSLPKAISLSKGLVWTTGVIAELHTLTLELANANLPLFVAEMKKLKKKERASVFYFFNNASDAGVAVQALIYKLNAANQISLVEEITRSAEQKKP